MHRIARQSFLIFILFFLPGLVSAEELPLNLIKLPPGFTIDIYAKDLPNVRSMALGEKGTVFVGTRKGDKVYALVDKDGDHKAEKVYVVAEGLNAPNGVAFQDGTLYVAEISRILSYYNIENILYNPPIPGVFADLPSETWHGWKYIGVGPDKYLYVAIGSPCNVCVPTDERFGTIMSWDTKLRIGGLRPLIEVYARGIRNSVGFDWDPRTGDLWFTDNGRDMMGDDLPPDELNHAPRQGMDFGFPYCHGKNIPDPEFGKLKSCGEITGAAQELGPHVASLGMKFYTGTMFPESFRNQIFIAEHGSWNRTKKIGYRITVVKLENNIPVDYKVFAEGWHSGNDVWGRPVDLLVMPDGALLVSDDHSGTVYRISYKK